MKNYPVRMSVPNCEYDIPIIAATILAFALPLTMLIPGFTIWSVIPKIRVIRFLIVTQELTWDQLNAAMVSFLVLFFCLYLEIKKRILDDMVENVLSVSQTTDKSMEEEGERQNAAVRVCVDLLDSSSEHYESLVLLRDELRQRTRDKPPVIELSASEL